MSYNIVTFGKKRENLNLAIKNATIGSFLSTFPDYILKGATIFLHCESQIWGSAKIHSEYFRNDSKIWEDKVYPHRFLISEIKLTDDPVRLTNGIYNTELRSAYGTGWAYKFLFSPKPLPIEIGKKIDQDLNSRKTVEISDFLNITL